MEGFEDHTTKRLVQLRNFRKFASKNIDGIKSVSEILYLLRNNVSQYASKFTISNWMFRLCVCTTLGRR